MSGSARFDAAKMAAGRVWACERWPYLATGLLALDIVPTPGLGTFAVDTRWHVYVDPDVVDGWTAPQIGIVLNHELQHLLRAHADRAQAIGVSFEDRQSWNLAADAEINDDLFSDLWQVGDGLRPVLPRTLGQQDGHLAEHYFRHLIPKPGSSATGFVAGEEGSGVDGMARPWERDRSFGLDAREGVLLRRSIAVAVAAHARSGNHISDGLRRWAESETRTAVDWRSVLASLTRAQATTKRGVSDYSYRHLSRRTPESGVILPGMISAQIEVAIVVDTSASVSDQALAHAATEVAAIARIAANSAGPLHLIPCDMAAARPRRIFPNTTILPGIEGGGGTDMSAGIQASHALRPRPDVIIVITDGETPWPQQKPIIPVIVALLDHGWAPPPPDWAHPVRIALERYL